MADKQGSNSDKPNMSKPDAKNDNNADAGKPDGPETEEGHIPIKSSPEEWNMLKKSSDIVTQSTSEARGSVEDVQQLAGQSHNNDEEPTGASQEPVPEWKWIKKPE